MKIAIVGIRGVPARYGGFETFAEELGSRLVERGHQVVVYGRKHLAESDLKSYRGMEIRLLPTVRQKYLETPLHSLICFFHLLFHRVDVVLVCNAANSPFLWILRLAKFRVLVNVDGIERLRAKWNILGRLWYRLGEICSVLFSTRIIADAEVIRAYYLHTYRADATVIGYGFSRGDGKTGALDAVISGKRDGKESLSAVLPAGNVLTELGLRPDQYLLFVSRLEPENNAHVVIEAYNRLPDRLKDKPLVIVGDAPYARDYIVGLRNLAKQNVVFTGFRFGAEYQLLQLGAYLYLQATEVGGTHPALVEAMGYANCVVANKTPENIEVLAEAGAYYEKNDARALQTVLADLLGNYEAVLRYRNLASSRVQERYDWEEITNKYEELSNGVLRSVAGPR